MPHPSVIEIVADLRKRYPDSPFMALGQTVFWDEPVKAAWRVVLDELWPDAAMVAGVHDTDYFAKSTSLLDTDDEYALLPHNDGPTRGLWSAAGELSTLFGSEDVPTRSMYETHGVPFARLASRYEGGKKQFYEEKTEAWGWRGIVQTASGQVIAHDVPLKTFGPVLVAELEWGFGEALDRIAEADRERCGVHCREVLDWVQDCIAENPDGNLSDLYRSLLPRFYETLLGAPPAHFTTTHSVSLFRFNSQTYRLPRFDVVDLFLAPATRQTCVDAYNRAVAGGGMYALDTFGEGALPFDAVVPGRGRGTLRVIGSSVAVEFSDGPVTISASEPVVARELLAAALEGEFGDGLVLIGKAVSLIDMLAAEFIVLFHETASGYTPRTAEMNETIRKAGISLDLKPIVRIAYPTWDALATANVSTRVRLPEHLATSFGTGDEAIPTSQVGSQWRAVVASAKADLKRIGEARSTRAALDILSEQPSTAACWNCARGDYDRSLAALAAAQEECADRKLRITQLREDIKDDTRSRVAAEQAKGADFRANIWPIIEALRVAGQDTIAGLNDKLKAEQSRRTRTYDVTITACADRIRHAKAEVRRLRSECRAIERSAECIECRQTLDEITNNVNMAKLDLIRSDHITREALPHTNARPSAWWLPTVDPSGAWFTAITDGMEARLEVV